MNTLNGYSKSTLTDLYVLTASGGHFPLIPTLDTLLSEINSVASKKCFPHLVSEQIDADVISSNYIYTDAMSVAGLIVSTVTEVAPLSIKSTLKVTNFNADLLDGYHVSNKSTPFGGIPIIATDGVIELGRYIDFHYDNTTGSDYSARLAIMGNNANVVQFPIMSGTLALTTDNVASATLASTVTCVVATGNTDRPIVGTNLSNLLYYTTKATVNWDTGDLKSTTTTTGSVRHKVTNSNGSVSILTSTNRGLYDETNSDWIISTNGTNTWASRGNFGIGTTSPSYKLHVVGSGYFVNSIYSILTLERTGSTNGALITFKNTNGILGHIGMTGDINGGLVRYTADANLSYTVLDLGNYASLLDQRYYTETESDSRFVNVTGDTMSGSLNTYASRGNWVSGMTGAAIKYNNLVAIDSTSFWKLFNMKSSSGNVVCFGGLGDNIGFHGYYSGRTANETDWRFTVNTNNGVWTSTASIYASHFYESSDVNLKTNIESINTSDNIPLLKSFDWKSDGSHSYGLIALELEELGYPELVSNEGDYKTVNYSAALSLIVGKLQVKIKELEKEIENLKNKN